MWTRWSRLISELYNGPLHSLLNSIPLAESNFQLTNLNNETRSVPYAYSTIRVLDLPSVINRRDQPVHSNKLFQGAIPTVTSGQLCPSSYCALVQPSRLLFLSVPPFRPHHFGADIDGPRTLTSAASFNSPATPPTCTQPSFHRSHFLTPPHHSAQPPRPAQPPTVVGLPQSRLSAEMAHYRGAQTPKSTT